ncbi:hypothetical protein E4U21_003573 [Claviceps maximensis]|nr:hypothetical protein E4U21_003573 [Claviceps maximensis]
MDACVKLVLRNSSSHLLTRIDNHGHLTAEQLKAIPLGDSSSSSSSDNHSIPLDGDRRLRVFMSADSPHINLCKSVMSAVAVGYPAPILLNWAGEFNHPHGHVAGRPAAKLEGLLAVVDDLLARAEGEDSDVHEEDLAVLVDAHHVWFQLPPSVLIQRYHQLNREADQRLHWQWEAAQGNHHVHVHATSQFPIEAPRQSIVVTAAAAAMAKDCQPKTESSSTPLSDDGYGQGKEKLFSPSSSSSSSSLSSTCLSPSGAMVMGTMASLQRVLRRAKAKMETATQRGRQTWSDQTLLGVLAEVLREQDMWRAWMRDLGNTWNGTTSQNDLSRLPRPVRAVAKASMAGERFEFGIGLDHVAGDDDRFSTISSVANANGHAPYGGAFVKINNVTALREASTKAGLVSDDPLRLRGVPDELSQKKVGSTDLEGIRWGDVPLYSDLYHGFTPVGLYFDDDHNNSKKGKDKDSRLVDWWAKMWFHPRLRTLVAHAMMPLSQDSTIRPLARIPTQSPTSAADKIRYWAPKAHYRNPKVQVFEPHTAVEGHSPGGSYNAIAWEGICQGDTKTPWHEEIFGDKKGPWQF